MAERRCPPLLAGARVQKAQADGSALVLHVREVNETVFVLVGVLEGRPVVLVLDTRPPKSGSGAAPPDVAALRRRVEGALVVGVSERELVLALDQALFAVEAIGGRVRARKLDDAPDDLLDTAAREAALARGRALLPTLARETLELRRTALVRAIERGAARLGRRIDAIVADLARIEGADALAARATLFVAEAARAPRGASKLTAVDWSRGEPAPVELPLDPARGAREQVDQMFHRARRLKQGAAVAEKRLAEARSVTARLDDLRERARSATAGDELERLLGEARAVAPRDFRVDTGAVGRVRGPSAQAPLPAYRTFLGAGGARILVGRGAEHNDALTFRVARLHDLWLHAKGRKGAHVVVPLERGRSCPADLLVDAAHLAAHFSDARGDGLVEVQHTERRHLRKPRGSPPGFVVVGREKVLALRVDEARTAALLAREA